ncbi:MAG: 4-(cytidine 5'-diphospho)-2-C-methyl-D-erythritol kinase [Solirubrobacteraceae bacterium]
MDTELRLRVLAPAKVNLALFLGPTRADGRHQLVTVFQSLSLSDQLDVTALDTSVDEVSCQPLVEGENIVVRAIEALRAHGWDGPGLRIAISKRIPVAAGMAGGSADAAAALRAAMAILPGRPEELDAIAAELGADVPGQLLPGTALGVGAGEVVEHFEPLAEHAYVVVPAPFALATPDVYREADRLGLPRREDELRERYERLAQVLKPGVRLPAGLLTNDLQPASVSLCPWCAGALDAVRQSGADHVMVSGSGPTVVGIWWGAHAQQAAQHAARALAGRYPRTVVARPVDAQYALPALT